MQDRSVEIGIADLGRYVPERFVSAAEISSASGIPAEVLVEKFGLKGKHVSSPEEHVTDMCVAAAQPILSRVDPCDVDAVVYFGSHWKDHLIWNAAPKISHKLGIEGFALEMINVSAGAPIVVRAVADMMKSDPDLGSVLIVGASKESHLLDYENPKSRFMVNFGDGAVAALLRREHPENIVLSSSFHTDGSFTDHVGVFGGGSVNPASHETIDSGMHLLDVNDGPEMKRRLDPITLKQFIQVTREALEKSRLASDEIDLLLPIHFKRSLHDQILLELGLTMDQSIYLDHFGHMSAVDPLFALSIARDEGRLKDGDIALLLAAGTGYTWAATALRWGPA